MKHLLLSLFVVVCLSGSVTAEPFQVGKKRLEIPAPAGFIKVTPQMHALYRLSEQMIDPVNDQLACYIPEADRAQAEAGTITELDRFFLLKVNKKLKSKVMGSNDFAKLKAATKNQNQVIIDTVKSKMPEVVEKMSQGLSKEFDLDIVMKLSDVVPLEPHYEAPNAMSFTMFITYNMQANGSQEDAVLCCTTTFLNTDGKILFLYCYADQDEMEWTRQASRSWAESILSSNAQAPDETPGNGGLRQYRWAIKWVIFGLIFALASIIKSAKNKGKQTV
ncbi:hypothetical protein [Gimesia panareensis]|uniref:Uncharacterized protein n=1 Tax=Gimesia panareensis TaxID=2527978 RepID=A0A518FZ85_9PLAN|nr:hypothetical protein [Gimesia panareensis]QDT30730.1 hypothetical protein Enr10x_60980 [Gimesia panareensis]QDU53779.1 hypothetical protein Pan110_61730 [Gimesia panareensis]QDV21679.1 hypothetical protein Pan153_63690 [Gimesia panareensis]